MVGRLYYGVSQVYYCVYLRLIRQMAHRISVQLKQQNRIVYGRPSWVTDEMDINRHNINNWIRPIGQGCFLL